MLYSHIAKSQSNGFLLFLIGIKASLLFNNKVDKANTRPNKGT